MGLSLLPYCAYQTFYLSSSSWLYLAALTVITSCFAVKVQLASGKRGSLTVSVSDFFIFAAILLFGPAVAVVIAAIEGLMSSLKVKIKRLYKYLFNIAQLALGAFVVGQVFNHLGGGPISLDATRPEEIPGLVFAALFCGLLYFMIQ